MASNKLSMKNIIIICLIIILLTIISIPVSAFWGSADLTFSQVVKVFKFKLNPVKYPLEEKCLLSIVWELRLPRILLAIAVGSGLAMCGATMQALTRNVMAEPYTLGVASGASVMAALSIVFLGDNVTLYFFTPSVAAFIGAILAMFLVYSISSSENGASNIKLILTGIAISMICSALTQLIISLAPKESKVRSVVFWTMGGFGGARWGNILFPILVATIGGIILYSHSETLNLLAMGNDTAIMLGVSVEKIQKRLIVIISLITGTMVAAAGCIGFIGLIIPHIVRHFVGADHRKMLPITMLLGGLFMIWTDAIARWILSPRELAIGVLTALMGGPFFLTLLRKNRG